MHKLLIYQKCPFNWAYNQIHFIVLYQVIRQMVKIIENYILNESIGEGNYGTVYRATNKLDSKQQFAVKVIPIQKFQENEKLQIYTENEIQALTTIGDSQHIIKYYQMIKSKHNYYFVYEYCNKGTLMGLLKKQKTITEKRGLWILKQLIKGFKVLNKNNIMHRDLKPQNIFFTTLNSQGKESQGAKSQKVKIGDFGFCKGLRPQQNLAKTMLGSPIYMAPQVLKGEAYTSKADIWSLGVILYQMLYGVCPYQSNSIAMLINTIDSNPINLPSQIQVSQKTKTLIKKMLTKDFYRRIGWTELFGYRINDEGQYIEEEGSQNNPKQESGKKTDDNKPLYNSSTLHQIAPRFTSQNRSYSVKADQQQIQTPNAKNSHKQNKQQSIGKYSSSNKKLELSLNSNKKQQDKEKLKMKYLTSVATSPTQRKQTASMPKQQSRFHSQKYMSIFSTPLSLSKPDEKNQTSNKNSKISNQVLSDVSGENQNNFNNKKTKPSREIKLLQIQQKTQRPTLQSSTTRDQGRQQKIMSMAQVGSSKLIYPQVRTENDNGIQSHKFLASREQPSQQGILIQRASTEISSPTSFSEQKRYKILSIHEIVVKLLVKMLAFMQQESKKDQCNSQKQYLHDMYIILKFIQERLKHITISVKITETNLLDITSIINYQLLQVERMIIETRNKMLDLRMELPSFISYSSYTNGNLSNGQTQNGCSLEQLPFVKELQKLEIKEFLKAI